MGVLRETEQNIIRHALGLYRSHIAYRNAYCAGADHESLPAINSLAELGFMRADGAINDGATTVYVVTDAGKAALRKTK